MSWETTNSYGSGTSINIADRNCSLALGASHRPTSSQPYTAYVSVLNYAFVETGGKLADGVMIDGATGQQKQSGEAITQADIEACGYTGVNVTMNNGPAATFAETANIGLEFTGFRHGVQWKVTATALGTADGQPTFTLKEERIGGNEPYVVVQDSSSWQFQSGFGMAGDVWKFRLYVNNKDGSDAACAVPALCSVVSGGKISSLEAFTITDVTVGNVGNSPTNHPIFSFDNSGGNSFLATIQASKITGPVTVTVPANKFRGRTSLLMNIESATATFTPPLVKPTVTLSEFVPVKDSSGNVNYLSAEMTVDVPFLTDIDNFGVTNGRIDFNTGNPRLDKNGGVNPAGTYPFRVYPEAVGQIEFDTKTGVFDGRGSQGPGVAGAKQISFDYSDAIRPEITVESVYVSHGSVWVKFQASESITLEANDVVITGGPTIDVVSSNPGARPQARLRKPVPENVELTFQVAAESVTDVAGNTNELASNVLSWTYDTLGPEATLSEFSFDNATGLLSTTLTTNEALRSTPSTSSNLWSTTNGKISRVDAVGTSGREFTVFVEPSATGEVKLQLLANAVQDNTSFRNYNADPSNEVSFTYTDTTPPVAVLGEFTAGNSSSVGDYFSVRLTINNGVGGPLETPTGLSTEDLVLTGGTFDQDVRSRSSQTLYVLPEGGPISLHVKANSFQDASGNDNTQPSNTVTTTYTDTTPPTITLGALALQGDGTYTSAVTINESVTNFTVDDLTLTNATATMTGSGKAYTVTLTPSAPGELRLSVAAGTFTDSSNNANTASNEVTATYVDTFAPSIVLGALAAQGGGVFTTAITISEDVTTFELADLTLVNATATLAGSGKSYTATLTSTTADGTIKASVAANTFTDPSGNDNTASNEVSVDYDSTPPTVTIGALSGPTAGKYTATITLSEAVQSFASSDLTLTNASASLAGSGTSYTATLTPAADGRIALSVAKDAVQDASGNRNAASNEVEATYDSTGPTVTISDLVRAGLTYTATVTLSEPVVSFAASDFTAVNGAVALSGSGTSYSIVFTPAADGAVSLHVAADKLQDAAGNKSSVSNTVTATYQAIVPEATLSNPTGPVNGVFSMDISLNAASTDFAAEDITVSNGSVTGFTGSGTSYTATITPAADGDLSAVVNANTFTDEFNTNNVVSNSVRWSYDGTPPTVTIAALSGPTNGTFSAAITISENTTDFTVTDLTLTNATAVLTGSGVNYSVVLTPAAEGDVAVSVASGKLTDAAGNGNTASNEARANYDITPPTITIAELVGPTNGKYTASITISEATTNFELADLTLVNATATMTGSGASYTVELTPVTDGDITLSVAAGVFSDAAGNLNTASNTVIAVYDTTPPTVTVGTFQGPLNGQRTVMITTNEETVDFTAGDLTLVNLTVNSLVDQGDKKQFLATVTPIADGDIRLSVAANVFTDAAGNGNVASNEVKSTHDGTAPTVEITAAVTDFTGTSPFVVTFTFPEDVTGFAVDDVTVTKASISDFAGGPKVFTAKITPAGAGDVTIGVAANVLTDIAGNGNTAATTLTVKNNTVEVTQKAISDYIGSRANNLLANQPNATQLMIGTGSGNRFDANVTRGVGRFDFQIEPGTNSWLRLKGAWSQIGVEDSRYAHAAMGHHTFLSDNLMVGGMLQFDYAHARAGAATTEGYGWLAGPYMVMKHATQPLYFELSALAGQSDNTVSPIGTYTDAYKTDRLLVTGRVTGEIDLQSIVWRPNVTLSHVSDKARSYTDSLGGFIPETTLEMTELAIAVDFTKPLDLGSGLTSLTGGVSTRFSSTKGFSTGQAAIMEDPRLRLDLGFDHQFNTGTYTSLRGYYDGVMADQFSSYGLEFRVDFKF